MDTLSDRSLTALTSLGHSVLPIKTALMLLIFMVGCSRQPFKLQASRTTLLANGYDAAEFKISGSDDLPQIAIVGDHRSARLQPPHLIYGHWEASLIAGVIPGSVRVLVTSHGRHAQQTITLTPQITDSQHDGTPDFLRLETVSDRESFLSWMTYLAEIQYFIAPQSRSSEITDCSALIRYAYREAMREHDAGWLAGTYGRLPLVPGYQSIRKYSFPHTLLGANIFRTRSSIYYPSNLTDGTFREFADAKTLQQFNTFFVSRDVARAQPGDVLFYRRETTKGVTYHCMVFIGHSKVKPDGEIYVVYHTGPDGSNEGEIRRVTLTQLLHFPNPQWQAIAANPLFLGVYRWNILKAPS